MDGWVALARVQLDRHTGRTGQLRGGLERRVDILTRVDRPLQILRRLTAFLAQALLGHRCVGAHELDLRTDGTYRGFEDFCVLNGRRTDQKYSGSYETRVLRRFQQFANSPTVAAESLQLFRLIVFNCAIRNGDAHLKNFGVVYDDVQGAAHLAPAYDLVTTTAYIPKDRMALTLNGSTEWPSGM